MGWLAGTSTNIIVSPAAAFRLAIHAQPSSTATAGQPFATQPVVYEVDQFGNVETGDNSHRLDRVARHRQRAASGHNLDHPGQVGSATYANLANNAAGDHVACLLRRRTVCRTVQ